MIKENIELVRGEILNSCTQSGRNPAHVHLIAVSKTKPNDMILEAYHCGIRDFGENKVQELLKKKPVLPEDIRWHMIGHLQTNKVKQIIGEVAMIHSVDSTKLADAIDVEAMKKGIRVSALLEVNVAQEPSKYGFLPEEIFAELEKMRHYKALQIRGLMTVAPNVADPEENRAIFRKLKQLSVDIKSKNIDNIVMKFLSMGMSTDYTVATSEGADFVRIGTTIFGSRNRLER